MRYARALLVIISDFHVVSVSVLPSKADTPLVVDANGVLPLTVVFKSFQGIPAALEIT
jgi:hypothetical protein